MTYGFRVKMNCERIEPAIIESFRGIPVANVSDSMSRICALGVGMRPMHRSGTLAGPALTVRTRPGDNLMLHKAIDIAQPGDVIVVDAGADMANSLMGELMLAHAIRREVAGFVLNGAIRDAEAFLERNTPVFACGVTHRGPYRTGPGEIGFPIAINGTVVHPGDLILGDLDGVVCVPKGDAIRIHEASIKKHKAEEKQMAETEAGTVNRDWVEKALRDAGCEFID